MGIFDKFKNINQMFAIHPLTCNAQLKAWGRFAKWQFACRLHDESLFEWIEGQKLVVRRGMHGATGNIYVGLHEPFDMMVLLHFLRPGDLFLDVGANVGTYTVLASGICGANTIAFEPDPVTAERLRRNIGINKLSSLVTVCECAVVAASGEIPFTTGRDTMNHIVTESNASTRAVRAERLDAAVGDLSPVMMKIDVEGYELGVLQGASGVLNNPALQVLEIETVTPEASVILHAHGFEETNYDPFTRSLSQASGVRRGNNALFVRGNRAFIQHRLESARKINVLAQKI